MLEATKMLKLGFIGAGTVGTAMAVRLSHKGYHAVAVYSRSRSSAQRLADAISVGIQIFNDIQGVA
jgi:predicted short-subunit dehydrogenase-like oxidoreductase (DUF2520 family)